MENSNSVSPVLSCPVLSCYLGRRRMCDGVFHNCVLGCVESRAVELIGYQTPSPSTPASCPPLRVTSIFRPFFFARSLFLFFPFPFPFPFLIFLLSPPPPSPRALKAARAGEPRNTRGGRDGNLEPALFNRPRQQQAPHASDGAPVLPCRSCRRRASAGQSGVGGAGCERRAVVVVVVVVESGGGPCRAC